MNKSGYLLIALLLGKGVTFGQANPLAPSGSNTYVTGITAIGSAHQPSCPLFVWIVDEHSPAANLDIRTGDELLSVDGQRVTSAQQARPLLRTATNEPAELSLRRAGKTLSITVPRIKLSDLEERNGTKVLPDGSMYPLDATDAEVKYDREFIEHFNDRLAGRVFATHYPGNMHLYYPGFEIFILKGPSAIVVGGLEQGPASDAGIHWGDVIISVNGTNPVGKSTSQLESLFSSDKPKEMTLVIDRAGSTKTLSFSLANATAVLHRNHREMYKATIIPAGMPSEYLHCWERPQ